MISLDDDKKMKFSYVSADAVGNPNGIYDDKMDVWNNWKSFVNKQREKAP